MKEVRNLSDVQFGLSEHTLNKQKKVKSDGEISTLLGKKNVLSGGEPEVLNLIEFLKEKIINISAEVKLMLDEYDFYQAR